MKQTQREADHSVLSSYVVKMQAGLSGVVSKNREIFITYEKRNGRKLLFFSSSFFII
jgi:hypothetical protein